MNNCYQESTVHIRFVSRSYIFISILQQCAKNGLCRCWSAIFALQRGVRNAANAPKSILLFCAHQALSTTSDAFTPFAVPGASMYWGD